MRTRHAFCTFSCLSAAVAIFAPGTAAGAQGPLVLVPLVDFVLACSVLVVMIIWYDTYPGPQVVLSVAMSGPIHAVVMASVFLSMWIV